MSLAVPALCGAAVVVLVDDKRRLLQAVRRYEEGRTVDVEPEGLSAAELQALDEVLPIADGDAPPEPSVHDGLQAVPLRHGERLVGALLLHGPLTSLGEALLDEVAARAAIVIAAAQLHQSLQVEIAERRQAETRLEEASRRKDEFLAMLSHELRNPLAPIRNAVEVIRRKAPNDNTLMWATDITDRQVRQLTRLVDELLDVARISQGKIVLQQASLDLCALVAECVEAQRPFIAARRQLLTLALPSGPVPVQGDAARIQQVISNLLSNAIKYTQDDGSLHVGVALEDGQTTISVRDNGMGIEADLLPRVFDLFEQGHRALDRSQGGLGIGLTLVQLLVKLHGGRVEALSAGPGHGAEFRVHLPAGQLEGDSDLNEPEQTLLSPRRRILIVEDNADVADTTVTMLAMSGHEVRAAHDGIEALGMVEAFAPEIVLLDIGLPMMDGYEVARRLRQLPATRDALIVALTGYGQASDRQRGREAGFDEHLLKPVDPVVLEALIARGESCTDRSAGPAGEDSSAAPKATLYAFRHR